MDSTEIKTFIQSIMTLLGTKEVHFLERDTMLHSRPHIQYLKKQMYLKQMPEQPTGTVMQEELTYNIESLRIKHTSRKSKFNLRRSTSSNKSTKIIVIPTTLIRKDKIREELTKELHGRDVISVEFISRLRITESQEEDDIYSRSINILGHNCFINLSADSLQHCEFTYEGFRIHDIQSVKGSCHPKIPLFTSKEIKTATYKEFRRITYEYPTSDSIDAELCVETRQRRTGKISSRGRIQV